MICVAGFSVVDALFGAWRTLVWQPSATTLLIANMRVIGGMKTSPIRQGEDGRQLIELMTVTVHI